MVQSPTFFENHWGDIASVIGVIISIIGFIFTIVGVRRSKNAAQRAEEAARDVQKVIFRSDIIMDLSAAVTIMDEIKRLHRVPAWVILPDRYSTLKRILVNINSSNSNLSKEHKTALQSAIQQFTDIERKVERALASESPYPNVAAINDIVSTQADKIGEVLATIRQDVGIINHGTSENKAAR